MQFGKDDKTDNDFLVDKRKLERTKEYVLDEDFNKAKTGRFNQEKKTKDKHLRKKPFLLLGIALIIIGASCFVTANYGPWTYVKYEPIGMENVTIEKVYYKDFQTYDGEDTTISNFFLSESGEYIGITSDDISPYYKMSIYISYALILIGAIFTVIQIISRIFDFEYKISLIIHSFFAAVSAVICVYAIFLSVKFFSAFILYLLNFKAISTILGKPIIAFIAPLILLFIFSGALKICFVVLKTDYNELEDIFNSKRPKKTFFDFRHRGGRQ